MLHDVMSACLWSLAGSMIACLAIHSAFYFKKIGCCFNAMVLNDHCLVKTCSFRLPCVTFMKV